MAARSLARRSMHTSGVIACRASPVELWSSMRRFWTGDVWVDAKLLQAEERAAEARAYTARRALLRAARGSRSGAFARTPKPTGAPMWRSTGWFKPLTPDAVRTAAPEGALSCLQKARPFGCL